MLHAHQMVDARGEIAVLVKLTALSGVASPFVRKCASLSLARLSRSLQKWDAKRSFLKQTSFVNLPVLGPRIRCQTFALPLLLLVAQPLQRQLRKESLIRIIFARTWVGVA
jgi:hypothetical protein